jgi:parallel beta-helix repeat protein
MYVDDDASLGGDGHSWAGPCKCLQDALLEAAADPTITEIRVAGGIYKPDQDEGGIITPGDRSATFQLITGLVVKGGYAGLALPGSPNDWDAAVYLTTLSGDLAGDDGPNFANNDENSYQVVTGSGTDATAVLDGVTITGGHADGSGVQDSGAAFYCDEGRATLSNCIITANTATDGGGIYAQSSTSPTITDCTIIGNVAAGRGGGLCCEYFSPAVIKNCSIIGNTAGYGGGGVYSYYSGPQIINCTIAANVAVDRGGGIAGYAGGPGITSCIIWGNTSYGTGDEVHFEVGSPMITYTCVQGGHTGTGNISDDPLFVPGPLGCYYLGQTEAGNPQQSPCVDAGKPSAPLIDGTTRWDEALDTGVVDMGYHCPVSGLPLVMGDFNRNQNVELADFGGLQACFTGQGPAVVSPCCRIFDFEPDDDIDLDDWAQFHAGITGP